MFISATKWIVATFSQMEKHEKGREGKMKYKFLSFQILNLKFLLRTHILQNKWAYKPKNLERS